MLLNFSNESLWFNPKHVALFEHIYMNIIIFFLLFLQSLHCKMLNVSCSLLCIYTLNHKCVYYFFTCILHYFNIHLLIFPISLTNSIVGESIMVYTKSVMTFVITIVIYNSTMSTPVTSSVSTTWVTCYLY